MHRMAEVLGHPGGYLGPGPHPTIGSRTIQQRGELGLLPSTEQGDTTRIGTAPVAARGGSTGVVAAREGAAPGRRGAGGRGDLGGGEAPGPRAR